MKCRYWVLTAIVAAAAFLCDPAVGGTVTPTPVLGGAQSFSVLGGSTVTNTGSTTLTGQASLFANLGVSPGTALTGEGGITYTGGFGSAHLNDALAQQAQFDNVKAFNALNALVPPTQSYSIPTDLGGRTLSPGVYHFDTSVGITGLLQLDAQSTNGAYWVFQIGSTLTTADTNSVVQLINAGGNNGSDVGVFWLVGSSATLGTYTTFEGNILALTSITLTTGAQILNGRALAQTGAVTMDSNTISDICPLNNFGPGFSGGLGFDESGNLVPIPVTAVPEPISMIFFATGLVAVGGYMTRRKMLRKA